MNHSTSLSIDWLPLDMSAPETANGGVRVLFATPECAPLAKTGGLGDVSAALPAALYGRGIDIKLLLPGYPSVLAHAAGGRELGQVRGQVRLFPSRIEARLLESRLPSGTPLLVLDCPELYLREGGPYADARNAAFADNARRFALLSRVAAAIGSAESPIGWQAQVVHGNDWPAGLAPAYLHFMSGPRAASITTIHNLAFQGLFDPGVLSDLDLPRESYSIEGLEFHGQVSFMKAGLYYADAITAVSTGYAAEIQTVAYGCGLHGLLQARRNVLHGIVNGIDTNEWNPLIDARLPVRYSERSLPRKRRDKEALQRALGLALEAGAPLAGVVSRLTHQKGSDLIAAAGDRLVGLGAQIAVLGSGDRDHEEGLRALAARHPGQVAVRIGFDEDLAHLIEAGSDLFLMPSRFEPCGMNQMYSQRYGTPPVVHATGGLADTVVDCTPEALAEGRSSGFLFSPASAESLVEAVKRAISVYRDGPGWRALCRNAMRRDFSWDRAALEYERLYQRLVADNPKAR